MLRSAGSMDSGAISLGLMVILGLLMIAAAISDIRSRTISNELNAAMALLAIPFWIASGLALWPDLPIQFGSAFLVFLLFAGLFAIGAIGGGDVKMIGAVMLWIPLPLFLPGRDRKGVVWGKSVSVRVDIGGRGSIKKKTVTRDVACDN